jgi:AGZA family xanthine/uracil permease-like MFS transporter
VFLFLYLVMYPVYLRSHDPELAWKVGVAACFLSGVIEAAGAFVGAALQRVTPRAASSRRSPARRSRTSRFCPRSTSSAARSSGLVPLAIILLGYFARVRLPLNLPAGLVAVAVGSGLAWATGMMQADQIAPAPRASASTCRTRRSAP